MYSTYENMNDFDEIKHKKGDFDLPDKEPYPRCGKDKNSSLGKHPGWNVDEYSRKRELEI